MHGAAHLYMAADGARGRVARMYMQMDKAALLGEVVRHVRQLRAKATDAAGAVLGRLPGEGDEVGVVEDDDHHHWRPADHHHRCPRRVRAWVCCADRPGLLSDLGRAVRSASARPVRAEIATVGGRTRSVMELDVFHDGEDKAVAVSTLRTVLRNVLLDDGGRVEHLAANTTAEEGYKRPRFSAKIGEVQ